MTQQELNRMWAVHLTGGRAEGVACLSTDQFEIVENVVSGRTWARPVGGQDWSETTRTTGNAVSEILREL